MEIIADARERNGAIPFLEAAVDESNRAMRDKPAKIGGGTLRYSVRTITRGDYAWLSRQENSASEGAEAAAVVLTDESTAPSAERGEGELMAVAERKTWKDLAASIKDDRSTGQDGGLRELRALGVMVFYIIEGKAQYKDDFQIGHIKFSALHSKVRHNMLRGIPFIQTADAEGTARLVVRIARDLVGMRAKGDARPWMRPAISMERELRRLCEQFPEDPLTAGVRGLLPARPEAANGSSREENSLPEVLTTRREQNVQDLILRAWMSIPKVKQATAALLSQNYTFEKFFGEEDPMEDIADLEYDGGRKVGLPAARAIVRCRTERLLQEGILASLPHMTPEKAQLVLDLVGMRKLCEGSVLAVNLETLRLKSGRCLGRAVARMLLAVMAGEE